MNFAEQLQSDNDKSKWGKVWNFGRNAKSLPDHKDIKPEYSCPVCHETFDTLAEAEECMRTPYETAGLSVGDLVIIPGYDYCRIDKDAVVNDHWFAFDIAGDKTESSHFDHDDQYFAYWVVTSIHPEHRKPHKCVVTVATNISNKLWGGWNPADGGTHYAMFRPGLGRQHQRSDVDSSWWCDIRNGIMLGDRIESLKPSAKLLEEAKQLADISITSTKLL